MKLRIKDIEQRREKKAKLRKERAEITIEYNSYVDKKNEAVNVKREEWNDD